MDLPAVLARMDQRREELNLTDHALSVRAGLSGDAIRNWRRRMKGGTMSGINANSLNRIAEALQVSPAWLLDGEDTHIHRISVEIAGEIVEGGAVRPADDSKKRERVICPPQLRGQDNLVGYRVRGNAMQPVFQPGQILFADGKVQSSPDDETIGAIAICTDMSGLAHVRQLHFGSRPGHFNLAPIVLGQSALWDVKLRSALPVFLALPSEFVEYSG